MKEIRGAFYRGEEIIFGKYEDDGTFATASSDFRRKIYYTTRYIAEAQYLLNKYNLALHLPSGRYDYDYPKNGTYREIVGEALLGAKHDSMCLKHTGDGLFLCLESAKGDEIYVVSTNRIKNNIDDPCQWYCHGRAYVGKDITNSISLESAAEFLKEWSSISYMANIALKKQA